MKTYFFVLLLIYLFSVIISVNINENNEVIPFNGESFTDTYTTSEPLYFEIAFDENVRIKDYLKIELLSLDNEKNPNLVIAFSNKDEKCLDREQLSYGINNTQMWLTKAQLEEKKLYINLICSSKPCDFQLKLEGYDDNIEIDFNSQFNLYITENNKNVKIIFYSDSQNDESDFITIWALGNQNVEAKLEFDDDDKQSEKYSSNNIFKIKKSSINKSIFELTVAGEIGDVINIGSTTTYINDYNILTINKPEIKGFLKKGYSDEDCYMFSKDTTFYLSGIIHSKIAEIYYKNSEGEEKNDTITIINNGSFIETITPNSYITFYFCIRFPTKEFEKYDIDEIFYSLQVTNPGESEYKIGLYSPQLYGEIYPRRLKEGEEYSYIGITPDISSNQISFDMISQYGFPDMIYRLCKNYPICSDNEDLNPRSITGHTTHKMEYKYRSPMDPTQYTILVKCLKTSSIVTGDCAFKTSFNSDVVKINLKENEQFSQYLLKGEKDLYKVDFSGETKIKKIYVDLIVFTGDVNFNTNSTLTTKKIYNSNKIFFIVDIDKILKNKEIEFYILASKNSYYCIEFMFVREDDDSWLRNIIEPGISYLITIDPESKDSSGVLRPLKLVRFTNLRLMDFKQFLVQFYSLNCKLNVTSRRVDDEGNYYYKEIYSFDQYYQDNVPKNVINDYEYMLYVTETDSSKYNNKLCMVYASALEIENNKELDERQIVISDNEPKQMAFNRNNNSEIEYLYPHSNSSDDVIINLNFLDVAVYQVNVSFDHRNERKYDLTGNEIIYLTSYEWKNICKKNEICPIIIKIGLMTTFAETNPKLLISVKSVQDSSPTYLTKNQAKLDFLLGNNWQYYYTDLGENEEGDVLVSYRRGSGRLFGKIVSKNAEEPEEGATWREMYKFPKKVNESLDFYGYIKKIIISKNETRNCKDGCYLLLSLKTSIVTQDEYNYDFIEHPFSIIIHTRSSDKIEELPIINMPLSEYIIGNLFTHEDKNIYEYYSTIFTHNSNKISIDFQSKVVNLYINVGSNNKPTRNEKPDFEYLSTGEDTIFEISRDEFLNKCKEKGIAIPNKDSLLGLSITIGLWTEKTDSLYTTVYSLKMHLPFDEKLNIYEVKSDQKTLCKTELDKYGNNRCLFMVFYFGIEPLNHLLLYPFIQDHSSYEMFANYIMKEKYENFDYTYLNGRIPNNEATYSTRKTGLDYLYIPHGYEYDNFVFVSVITKQPTTVELLSSLYTFDLQLSPNPSSPQLFLLTNDHFIFEFTTYEELTITIQSIGGEGTIFWEEDESEKYTIHGKGQAISLANSFVDKNNNTKVFLSLYVQNKNQKQEYDDTCPGFAFFISYMLRPANINLDEIEIGKPSEFTYRADFPIYIYSEIKDFEKDVNFYVNLYELIGDNYLEFTNIPPFEINGSVVNNSDIMNYKLNPVLLNNLKFDFNGTYDSMIKTGFVLIKKEDIKKKIDFSLDGLSIIIKVSKNKYYKQMKNFTKIILEAAAIQENSEIPISPDLYHYGKLSRDNDNNIYKLKTNKAGKYMRIQYSPNSLHTKYTITTIPGSKSNSSLKEYTSKTINGKTVITFDSEPNKNDYIYLNIFHNDAQKAKTEKTTNYAFKYMTSDSIKKFPVYELKENEGFELETKKHGSKKDYIFTITPLSYEDIDIIYFIKFVKKDDWIDGESDNCIALRESKSFVEEFTTKETNTKFTKSIENIDNIDYRYLQIIALVRDNDGNVEYVSYKSIYRKDSNTWKIVLIIIAFIIVGIIVIYMVHLILKRRRNIDKKVEKISGPMISRISDAPNIE